MNRETGEEQIFGGEEQKSERELQLGFNEWKVLEGDIDARGSVLRGGVLVETAKKRRINPRFRNFFEGSVRSSILGAKRKRANR